MRFEHPFLHGIVAALAVFLTFTSPDAASAQQALPGAAPQGDTPEAGPDSTDAAALLAALATSGPDAARGIDRQLQALWDRSGSASMDLLLKRGRDAMEVGQIATAIEHFTALTDHAPDFAEGWHARASAYYAADLHGPALADLERALSLNPHNYNAIFGLGSILETFDEPELAHRAYLRVLAIHPHHEEVGKALERLGPRVTGQTL